MLAGRVGSCASDVTSRYFHDETPITATPRYFPLPCVDCKRHTTKKTNIAELCSGLHPISKKKQVWCQSGRMFIGEHLLVARFNIFWKRRWRKYWKMSPMKHGSIARKVDRQDEQLVSELRMRIAWKKCRCKEKSEK